MKKLLLVALTLCFLQFVGNAKDVQAKTAEKSLKCLKCQKEITSCTKRAKYYQNLAEKANQQGSKELADIYNKCADAKQKIADGLQKAYKNTEACQDICSQNSEITSELNDNPGLRERVKRMRMTKHIKNIQKCAELCLQKAKEAKPNLAKQYNNLAVALNSKAEGLQAVVDGKREFRNARIDFKAYNQAAKKIELTKAE